MLLDTSLANDMAQRAAEFGLFVCDDHTQARIGRRQRSGKSGSAAAEPSARVLIGTRDIRLLEHLRENERRGVASVDIERHQSPRHILLELRQL